MRLILTNIIFMTFIFQSLLFSQSNPILSVQTFNQCDNNWKDDVMGECSWGTAKICNSGCAITCLAMLLHSNKQLVNPSILNEWIIDEGFYNPCVYVQWGNACQFGTSTITVQLPYGAFNLNDIKTSIDLKNPVILEVESENDPGESHFIIITGYTELGLENKDFIVIDPAGGKKRRLSFYDERLIFPTPLRLFNNVNADVNYENIPWHCFNCVWDPQEGEIEPDCGGTCPPCDEPPYLKSFSNASEFNLENIATHQIFINSENTENTLIIDGNKTFRCNEQIQLSGDIIIPENSNVVLSVSNNPDRLTRDCDDDPPCFYYDLFTYDPYFSVNLTNTNYMYFLIWDRYDHIYGEDYIVTPYDGTYTLVYGLDPAVYFFHIDCYPCNAYFPIPHQGFMTILDPEDVSLSDNIENRKNKLIIYPNPTTDYISITFPENTKEYRKIEIRSINNVLVFSTQTNESNLTIDMSNKAKGVYILYLYSKDSILIKKILLL